MIDPPSWIKVTFTGTVNGSPFMRSAFYGGDGTHDAHISIGDLTASTGRTNIVVTATSEFLGTSHTARVTLDCPTTDVQGTGGPAAGNDGQHGGATAATAAEPSQDGLLPFTGGYALHLALIGVVTLVLGLGASRVYRRRQIGRASRGG